MPISITLRFLLRSLLVFLLSAPIIVLLLSVQIVPSVPAGEVLNPEEISRIEQLLLKTAPRSPGIASLQNIQLSAEELNLILRYGLNLMNLSPSLTDSCIPNGCIPSMSELFPLLTDILTPPLPDPPPAPLPHLPDPFPDLLPNWPPF